MTTRLKKLTTDADGRYFTAEERQSILALAESLPQRLWAAEQIEQNEEGVLRAVIEELQRKYLNFSKYHDQGWARQYRDLQLVLRAATQAMIVDDIGELDDRMLYWMRTMFAANNYTPEFVRDCFALLRDRLRGQLGSEAFALLQPFVDRTVEVLSDFPEPATPAV